MTYSSLAILQSALWDLMIEGEILVSCSLASPIVEYARSKHVIATSEPTTHPEFVRVRLLNSKGD